MSTIHKIAKPNSNCSVVFIHGVNGHWNDTWCAQGCKSWPQQLSDGRPWGVYSIEYEAHTNWARTTMPLQDRAVNLLNLIASHAMLSQSDLVIVAHSFGGVVAKQMVRAAHDTAHGYASFLDRLIGVIFVATPHTGAGIATFLTYLKRLLGSTVTIEDLRAHAPSLRDLGTWYRNYHGPLRLRALVLFETQRLKLGWFRTIKIVDPADADPALPGVVPVPVDADHCSIARPKSRDDIQFRLCQEFLEKAFSLPARLSKLPQQAGAVCYRYREGQLEFLLVRTSGRLWTFPKGNIDPGMTSGQAAVEEAFQEGGVTGQIDREPFTTYLHAKKELKQDIVAEYAISAFLMEVLRDGLACEPHRDPTWFNPQSAKSMLAEGREPQYGSELERVVDLAVEKLKLREQ